MEGNNTRASRFVQNKLLELAHLMVRKDFFEFESDIFKTPSVKREKISVTFCVENEEDLSFKEYDPLDLNAIPDMKYVTVNRSSEEDLSKIKEAVVRSIDSVTEADREFASVILQLDKIYFVMDDHEDLSNGRNILKKIHENEVRNHFHSFEWQEREVLKFLEDHGFKEVSREDCPSQTLLCLRGRHLRFRNEPDLYFNNDLELDSETLAFKGWEVQDLHPQWTSLMHGKPSANDVLLRSNVTRYVSADKMKLQDEYISDTWTKPGLGGYLQRTKDSGGKDLGFSVLQPRPDICLNRIREKDSGHRVHLRHRDYEDVDISIAFRPVFFSLYNEEHNKFTRIKDDNCDSEAKVEVSLRTGDRESLIEAVTQLTKALFNLGDQSWLKVKEKLVFDSDGTAVPVILYNQL